MRDDRNLRDREQFNNLVIQEFEDNNKKKRVNVGQQLIVMYLYLYYFNVYNDLVIKQIDKVSNDDLSDLIKLLLNNESSEYPAPFVVNRYNYMIFEIPSSLSIDLIEEILSNNDELKKELMDFTNSSLLEYFSLRYYLLTNETRERVLNASLEISRSLISPPSKTIRRIIMLEVQGGTQSGFMGRSFEKWSELLDNLHFSISEKIRFLTFNRIISYKTLGEEYLPQILEKSSFVKLWNSQKDTAFPEAIILCYVSYANIWGEFDKWSEDIWNSVEHLKLENFLYFCKMQNLFSETTKPTFALAKNTPSVDDPFEWQNNEIFLEKMKSKITEFGILIVDK